MADLIHETQHAGETSTALNPLPATIQELPLSYEMMATAGAEQLSRDFHELFQLKDRMLQYVPDALFVFRYEDARRLAANPVIGTCPAEIFVKMGFFGMAGLQVPFESVGNIMKFHQNSFFTSEPKVHLTTKRIIAQHLMAKEMPPFRLIGDTIAETLVDQYSGAGDINLLEDFGRSMAMRFWGDLYDMSQEERDGVLRAIRAMTPIFGGDPTPEALRRHNDEAIPDYWRHFVPAIRRAHQSGRHEFLNRIASQFAASASELPDGMAENFELVMASNMIDAFHVVATSAAVSVYELLRNPDAGAAVRRDPTLAPKAVAEALRLHTPVQAINRYAREAVDYDGLHIPAGTHFMIYWAAVNRDPTAFDAPNTFDLYRADKQQPAPLTFGIGPQLCPGRNIGQTLAIAAVNALIRSNVSIELAGEPTWQDAGFAPPTTPLNIPVRITRH